MLAGFTTEEAEADTVANQGLKRRSIARIWKDEDLAVTSAEEILNLSNGYIRTEDIYSRSLKEENRCCWRCEAVSENTLIAQCTIKGKMNRKTKQSTAIRDELSRESIAEF
ncbi:hypothetical protein F511_44683 [Dorcoceras hygrometricum]|uniref:Uncharacterized protein n=1 Tax=Dorcoceras hygrometricum TaxID=472368 RepID=A0A2Z6ZYR5_9LAMI|nr:hypothetical protein F511_44683 [Dorcoceras hygrometricum]